MKREEIQNTNLNKKSKIQHKISHLIYLANSRLGNNGEYPTNEQITKMYNEIFELRKELNNLGLK